MDKNLKNKLIEALAPFAEFADDMDYDGRDLKDEEGIYAFQAKNFRKAREMYNLLTKEK